MRARLKAQQSACINNLRQIDGAKQTWALENKAGATVTPVLSNIQPYLGRRHLNIHLSTSRTRPIPSRPVTAINDLQTAPTCLILPGVPGDTTGHVGIKAPVKKAQGLPKIGGWDYRSAPFRANATGSFEDTAR